VLLQGAGNMGAAGVSLALNATTSVVSGGLTAAGTVVSGASVVLRSFGSVSNRLGGALGSSMAQPLSALSMAQPLSALSMGRLGATATTAPPPLLSPQALHTPQQVRGGWGICVRACLLSEWVRSGGGWRCCTGRASERVSSGGGEM
jgi:hypothetical protein